MASTNIASTGDLGLRWTDIHGHGTIDIGDAVVNAIKGAVNATGSGRDVGNTQGVGCDATLAWWPQNTRGIRTDGGAGTIGGKRLLELRVGGANKSNQHLTRRGLGVIRRSPGS